MNLEQLLDTWRASPTHRANIAHWETLDPVAAVYAPFPARLDPRLIAALRSQGIAQLYSHQAAAFDTVAAGTHCVIVTPTASGKTLCYNLPVLNAILGDDSTRALYLFPTKALAQDQAAVISRLAAPTGASIKSHTFDGDTPATARKLIRTAGHIVITNPDMLHSGILPHHTGWVRLFESLRYVVIDELHGYRGVFGSHVANVIRRLRRICRHYGSDPSFIMSSATIANPGELASGLIGAPVAVIDRNGAPRGRRDFIFYNPPVVNHELGIRRGAVLTAAGLATDLVRNEIHTIVFARTRTTTELMLTYLRERLPRERASSVRGYRGGYLPNQRRAIEAGLRDGAVRAVVSTTALELGVDVGSLDAAILTGYPGTVASTWQQAGRAGRRHGVSVAVLVASSSPLDQFIVTHPDYFFHRTPEHGLISPDNLLVLESHLKCAAFELPFQATDEPLFGTAETATVRAVLDVMGDAEVVLEDQGTWNWTGQAYPAEEVSLRSAARENVVIVDETERGKPRVLGEVDRFSAPMLVHAGAIYFHEAEQYHVDRLEWDELKAYVHHVDVDYYTDASLAVRIEVLEQFSSDPVGAPRNHGEVLVGALPTIFKKIKLRTHENIGWGDIHLPEQQMHTGAYWLCFPPDLTATMQRAELQSALVGLGAALGTVAPLYLMCDPRDIGVAPELKSPFTGRGTVTIYDRTPGGVGFGPKLYLVHEALLESAHALIAACPCRNGCPSCVGPEIEVGAAGKAWTMRVLERLRAAGSSATPAAIASAQAFS